MSFSDVGIFPRFTVTLPVGIRNVDRAITVDPFNISGMTPETHSIVHKNRTGGWRIINPKTKDLSAFIPLTGMTPSIGAAV